MNEQYFIPLLIAGTILFLLFVFFIFGYIFINARRYRRHRIEKATMVFEHHKNLLNARLEEQERVMTQISKELHDNISQKIDFIHMNVKAMDEALPGEDQHIFRRNSNTLLEQVANDIRNVSYSLNSDYIRSRGLSEVLAIELDYIQTTKKINCSFGIEGALRPMPKDFELLIFRIAQEALHNILKYAKATEIKVTMAYDMDSIAVSINDNGIGFDVEAANSRSGLGLQNMKQRAELMNAQFLIVSAPGSGTAISLFIPVTAAGTL